MTGTAQVCEIRVREEFIDGTVAQVLRFDPPIVGDDDNAHEFGVACTTRGIVDVFAMDPAHPGRIVPDPDGYGWVSLLNCFSTGGPWTLDRFLASCGIEVTR